MIELTTYRTIDGFRTVNNDCTTSVKNLNKDIINIEDWNDEDREWIKATSPPPLEPAGALAALLSVVGVIDVVDAANAVGLTPTDLENEALAWGVASNANFNND